MGAQGQHAAFIGEFGFLANYHLGRNTNLHLGYDFMWVAGLCRLRCRCNVAVPTTPCASR